MHTHISWIVWDTERHSRTFSNTFRDTWILLDTLGHSLHLVHHNCHDHHDHYDHHDDDAGADCPVDLHEELRSINISPAARDPGHGLPSSSSKSFLLKILLLVIIILIILSRRCCLQIRLWGQSTGRRSLWGAQPGYGSIFLSWWWWWWRMWWRWWWWWWIFLNMLYNNWKLSIQTCFESAVGI